VELAAEILPCESKWVAYEPCDPVSRRSWPRRTRCEWGRPATARPMIGGPRDQRLQPAPVSSPGLNRYPSASSARGMISLRLIAHLLSRQPICAFLYHFSVCMLTVVQHIVVCCPLVLGISAGLLRAAPSDGSSDSAHCGSCVWWARPTCGALQTRI
jgi:hypothetical protein